MPRFRKVTLKELIESLNKAITTENRRIKKEIINRNALRESSFSIPKSKISIKNRIREIYQNLFEHFKENKDKKKISFTEFMGDNKEKKIISFAPLLHLEDQKKIWMVQEGHFEEIHIWLKEIYLEHNPDPIEELRKEVEQQIQEFDIEQQKRSKKIDEEFNNPLGEMLD